MNTNIDITSIVVALIGVLGTVITTYLIPYFKSKTTTTQWDNIMAWAKAGVGCAEILYNGVGKGKEKREYVEKYILDMCSKAGVKVNSDEVRVAIENAWKSLGLDNKTIEDTRNAK